MYLLRVRSYIRIVFSALECHLSFKLCYFTILKECSMFQIILPNFLIFTKLSHLCPIEDFNHL